MGRKPLGFDSLDIFLIHRGLADYVQPPKPLSIDKVSKCFRDRYSLWPLDTLPMTSELQLIAITMLRFSPHCPSFGDKVTNHIRDMPTYSRAKELAQEELISTAVGRGGCGKVLCGLFRFRSDA